MATKVQAHFHKFREINSLEEFLFARTTALAFARQVIEDLSDSPTGWDIDSARTTVSELRSLIARLGEWHK